MAKLLVCFFIFFLSRPALSQNLFCEQLSNLKSLVNTSHYAPKPIDDSLSSGVHKLFVKSLDKNLRFFTQEDIQTFETDRYRIDDYINSGKCDFITSYAEVLEQRIVTSKSIISDLATKNLDYSGKDTLYFIADLDYKYFKDKAEASKFWSKKLRYTILSKLIENDSVIEHIETNFKTLELEIKPKILQNELCLLDEILNQNGGIANFVNECFLNAFLQYQDPNSVFFNNSTKDVYENALANSNLSFGISTIKNEEGHIVISYIAPGSPAFKNVNLEVNDVIKSIRSNKTILETYCVSNDDVTSFINDKNNVTAIFKIKKSNGLLKDIELTKKLIEVETNSVRGYLIKNNLNMGYIEIPSFYTDLESPNGLGMANDVAKEIYKLKKENIQGLILDLRFNGGGSMKEAADLSGMFIDRGPVSIIKYSNGETFTIKDHNRGKAFSGPVVILVNQFSASASELFASVMQTYNIALIVGSKTHGKSSAQIILPLHEKKDLGFAKLTVETFYKPNGQSHQSLGVVPDIILPSVYDNFETEERHSDYALKNDSITPEIKHLPSKKLPVKTLKSLSSQRVAANKDFKAITDLNVTLLKNYVHKNTQYPLTLLDVYADINAYNNLWKTFKNLTDGTSEPLKFENTTYTNKIIQFNEAEKNTNLGILNDLSKDVTLKETYHILIDLIHIKNTN